MRAVAFAGEGSAVVVTGAGRGIGRATACTLAARGIHVVAVDVDEPGLTDTVGRIGSRGGAATAVPGDVTDALTAERAVGAARATNLPLKGLVNNAAVGAFAQTVENTTLEEWNRFLAIDLTSAFLLSKAAIPEIRAAGGGAIVHVSSIHAFASSTGVAPYAAAKGGLLALTRTMALDLAPDAIRVLCVIPGPVDTPMLRSHAEREGTTLEALGFPPGDRAIGHLAEPEELADVIDFALSAKATFMTGSALVADGGILAKF